MLPFYLQDRPDLSSYAADIAGAAYAKADALDTDKSSCARIRVAGDALLVVAPEMPADDGGAILCRGEYETLLHIAGGERLWFKRVGAADVAGSVELWFSPPA